MKRVTDAYGWGRMRGTVYKMKSHVGIDWYMQHGIWFAVIGHGASVLNLLVFMYNFSRVEKQI